MVSLSNRPQETRGEEPLVDENTPQPPAGGAPPPPGDSTPPPEAAPPPPPPPGGTQAPPPQQPQYAAQVAATPAPAKSGGGSKTGLIIGIVVVLLLLCCCGSTALGWYFYAQAEDEILDEITTTGSGTTGGTSGTTDSGESDVEAGEVVTVYASWSAPEDLDLEIWDEAGDVPLFPAYQINDVDVVDGAQGEEYFEFKAYDTGDYSSGRYTASVYFNGEMDADPAAVTVTVVRPDGSSDSITNSVEWDPALDQWHALVVDAETGDVEFVDEYW
jgi:hypothetical protein